MSDDENGIDEVFSEEFFDVKLVKDEEDLGVGALTVTNTHVHWKRDSMNFEWSFKQISLHALNTEDGPSVYCQLSAEDREFINEEEELFEICFYPKNIDDAKAIYELMDKGALLNPYTPENSFEDSDDFEEDE